MSLWNGMRSLPNGHRNCARHKQKRKHYCGISFCAVIHFDPTDNCHKAKLVVELDGSQHCDPKKAGYDQRRTAYLQSQGLEVVRFSNLDVLRRFRSVCEAIDMKVKERTAQRQ